MSLSTSLDEWLKQPPMSASAADDFAGSLAGDIPDLGLNLTPEDIKWVDLEFLDLASGPPANHHGSAATRHHHGHHSRGAHNPTLAGNFPDIFFDMTSSVGSLGNSSFPGPSGASSLMDEPPTATTLDLETEEKNFLAELFPPSAQIEQDEDLAPAVQVSTSNVPPSPTPEPIQLPATTAEPNKEDADVNAPAAAPASADVDGVYSVPSDVLLTIKRQAEPDALGRTITTKRMRPSAEPNSVAKISVKTDRAKNVTRVTILPSKGQRGQSHSFQINTANLPKVGKLLKPLQLERLSVFNKGVPPPAPASTKGKSSAGRNGLASLVIDEDRDVDRDDAELAAPDVAPDLQVKEVRLDKDQESLRVLEDHGIKLDGFTCATTKNGQKFWVCPEEGCKKAYPRPSKLKVHLMGHSNIKPFKCAVEGCGWAFTTAFKLKRHMNSHEKLKTAVCTKPGCGKEFSDVYNLKKHMLLHERELVYTCKDCGAECDTQPEYVKHLKVHKEKLLQEAAAAASLAAGANKVEDGGEDGGKFKCQHAGCEKAFKTQSALKMHFRLHTGSRPFVCSYEGCSWAFPSSSKLRRHERGHKNIRSYVCEICQKSYLRSEHLKNHQLSHDPLSHPFVCAFERCGQKFSAKSSLYVHMKRHPKQSGLLQGRLRCLLDACDGAFLYKKDLQAHMQLFHSAPTRPRLVEAKSNSSEDGGSEELDFIALLSAVDSDLPKAVSNAAVATPAIVTASNGIVLDHLITLEAATVANRNVVVGGGGGGGGGERLVTVDASAITPTKSQSKAAGGQVQQQQQRRSRCGRAIIPAIKI